MAERVAKYGEWLEEQGRTDEPGAYREWLRLVMAEWRRDEKRKESNARNRRIFARVVVAMSYVGFTVTAFAFYLFIQWLLDPASICVEFQQGACNV